MNTLELVKEFHRTFGQPIHDRPNLHDKDLNAFRLRLLREETKELEEALESGTEEDVLDALSDIQYILDGTFLSLGFHIYKERALAAVHESNMDKLHPDGTIVRRADGKIVKPPGWQAPNLKAVIAVLS